jgi:hypothetical protein
MSEILRFRIARAPQRFAPQVDTYVFLLPPRNAEVPDYAHLVGQTASQSALLQRIVQLQPPSATNGEDTLLDAVVAFDRWLTGCSNKPPTDIKDFPAQIKPLANQVSSHAWTNVRLAVA